MDGGKPMTIGDRLWAVLNAGLCAINVGIYAGTGSPLSAGAATITALAFFGIMIDGSAR